MKATVNIEYRYPGNHVGDVIDVEDPKDIERGFLVDVFDEVAEPAQEVSDVAPSKTED